MDAIVQFFTQAINEGTIPFLIRQTLIYAVPLMIVALAGVCSERSGVINLALEGIMIFGAFIGVLFVRMVQQWEWFEAAYVAKDWLTLQGFVLLTMAVMDFPNLLVMDEPVSGIDRNGMELFYQNIESLKKKYDMAIILISHDLEYVQRYADEVILLDSKILARGSVKEVYASAAFKEVFGEQTGEKEAEECR